MSGRPAGLPPPVRDHLNHPSLAELWSRLRQRLERSGHVVDGSVRFALDEAAADRLGGLLGRSMKPGTRPIRLADLDAALRRSAAGAGLVEVVGELTGSPLRDLPAERATHDHGWEHVWSEFDTALERAGLVSAAWLPDWVNWLHGSGVVRRLGADHARRTLGDAVAVLAAADLTGFDSAAGAEQRPTMLAALAARTTGSAHGLDEGRSVTALVQRALAIAFEVPVPDDVTERRALWQRVGIEPDAVSATVISWGLRPPGADRWSQMMNERADQNLITHLTAHELDRAPQQLTAAGQSVHACENPQAFQALIDRGIRGPMLCLSGNPTSTGLRLVSALRPRYHGDFDWPGVAIAGRVYAAGGTPWRMTDADYRNALAARAAQFSIPLRGDPLPTPWSPALEVSMTGHGTAVHEEEVIDGLLSDLD
jgi:uncharacterized protein (TIGR02679 family)